MNLLTAENIEKSFTERKLLNGASFYLEEGEKVGIIGINGTGKSTLLKILAKIEERKEAKKAKDFAKADAIRDELLEKGIVLKDTREGVIWHKA